METDQNRLALEGLGLSSEQIDEILPLLQAVKANENAPSQAVVHSSVRAQLEIELAKETDPIRRSILAAKIISHSLS